MAGLEVFENELSVIVEKKDGETTVAGVAAGVMLMNYQTEDWQRERTYQLREQKDRIEWILRRCWPNRGKIAPEFLEKVWQFIDVVTVIAQKRISDKGYLMGYSVVSKRVEQEIIEAFPEQPELQIIQAGLRAILFDVWRLPRYFDELSSYHKTDSRTVYCIMWNCDMPNSKLIEPVRDILKGL